MAQAYLEVIASDPTDGSLQVVIARSGKQFFQSRDGGNTFEVCENLGRHTEGRNRGHKLRNPNPGGEEFTAVPNERDRTAPWHVTFASSGREVNCRPQGVKQVEVLLPDEPEVLWAVDFVQLPGDEVLVSARDAKHPFLGLRDFIGPEKRLTETRPTGGEGATAANNHSGVFEYEAGTLKRWTQPDGGLDVPKGSWTPAGSTEAISLENPRTVILETGTWLVEPNGDGTFAITSATPAVERTRGL